jgi:hypothetical protein
MIKRSDTKCLFCNSHKCNHRVVSCDDMGKRYDEISCSKHSAELYKHSDENSPGIKKIFIESTGKLYRNDSSSVWKTKCEHCFIENARLREVVRMQTELLKYVIPYGTTRDKINEAIRAGEEVLSEP